TSTVRFVGTSPSSISLNSSWFNNLELRKNNSGVVALTDVHFGNLLIDQPGADSFMTGGPGGEWYTPGNITVNANGTTLASKSAYIGDTDDGIIRTWSSGTQTVTGTAGAMIPTLIFGEGDVVFVGTLDFDNSLEFSSNVFSFTNTGSI